MWLHAGTMIIIVSTAFALGTLLLQFVADLPGRAELAAGSAASTICALLLGRADLWQCGGRFIPRVAAGSLALVLGFAWAGWRASERQAHQLIPEHEEVDLVLIGAVTDLPQISASAQYFAFDIESSMAAELSPGSRVLLTWRPDPRGAASGGWQTVRTGERWRFPVRLRRPRANLNPHGFDYEAALLERGIAATGQVRPRAMLRPERLRPDAQTLTASIDRLRSGIRDRFAVALPEAPYRGVLVALAIGDQAAVPAAQWREFNRTGISHLMSISGLHITMLASLAALLVTRLGGWIPGLPLLWPLGRLAPVAGALAAAAYCVIAGLGVPAQRTLYMLLAGTLAQMLDRPPAPARALALALVLVVLIDPWATLSAGFWLSFGAVALLFHAGSVAGGEPFVRAWLRTQAVVTVGLAPLTLAIFGQVSLIGPLMNLIAIPLVSGLITPLSLIAAAAPFDAPARLAHSLLALTLPIVNAAAALPHAAWVQHTPAPWTIVLAVIASAWLLAPWPVRARGAALLLFVPMLVVLPDRVAADSARIDVLDVGQGLAVVIRTAHHTVLFDTGPPGGSSDAGQRIVLPFLLSVGRRRVDDLVISHPDADHAGGAGSLLAQLPVSALWLPRAALLPPSLERAREMPAVRERHACETGSRWTLDGVRFEFVHPGPDMPLPNRHANRASCVLRVAAGDHAMLLTGDIDRVGEAWMIAHRGASALHADVVLVPHHGSRGSSSAAFIQAVHPRFAVASAGYRNRYGHPRSEVIERYERAGAAVYRTDRDGALRIDLSAGGVRLAGLRESHPRYYRSRAALTGRMISP